MRGCIDSFSIFESEGGVEGLNVFIETLKNKYAKHLNVIEDLKDFIIRSGCKAIEFDTLYGASGISKTDKCVIADKILNNRIEDALYVILHEISHQYQYMKYGKNVMWDAYKSKIDIEEAVDLLMNIELVADRLAILKTNDLLKSNGVENYSKITPFYPNVSRSFFKSHLERLRKSIKDKQIDSIEGVNNMMHDGLKIKPKPIAKAPVRRRPAKLKNEVEIDRILDKLSSTGWSSLTDKEKATLRNASTDK